MKCKQLALFICLILISQYCISIAECSRRAKYERSWRSVVRASKAEAYANAEHKEKLKLKKFYESMGISGHLTTEVKKDIDQWVLIKNIGTDKCLKAGGIKTQLRHADCNPFDLDQHFKVKSNSDLYILIAKNTLAIDNENSRKIDNNKVWMFDANKSNAQNWRIDFKRGNGNFFIRNVSADNRCLQPMWRSETDNDKYVVNTCTTSNEFLFTFQPITTFWIIKSVFSDKCLKGSDKKGTAVTQQGCNSDDANQHFRVVPNGNETISIFSKGGLVIEQTYVNKKYSIVMNSQKSGPAQNWRIYTQKLNLKLWNESAKQCLGSDSKNVNTQMSTKKCTVLDQQHFEFQPVLDWNLIKVKGSGKCLKYAHKNAQLIQTACSWQDAAQQFRMESLDTIDGKSIVQLIGRNALAVNNIHYTNTNSYVVQMWDVTDSQAQRFMLKPTSGLVLNLQNPQTKKCMMAASNAEGAKITLQTCTTSTLQQFSFESYPWDQWVYMKGADNGLCYSMGDKDGDVMKQVKCTADDDNIYFRLQKNGESFIIFGTNGKVLMNRGATNANKNPVVTATANGSAAQNWTLKPFSGGYYQLVNTGTGNKCLHHEGSGIGIQMYINSCQVMWQQLYLFEPVNLVDASVPVSEAVPPKDIPSDSVAKQSTCTGGFGFPGKKLSDFWTVKESKNPSIFDNMWNKDIIPFLSRKFVTPPDAVFGDYTGKQIKGFKQFKCSTIPWKESETFGNIGISLSDMMCPVKPTKVQACITFDKCGSFGISANGGALACLATATGIGGILAVAAKSLTEVGFGFSYHRKIEKKFEVAYVSGDQFAIKKIDFAGHFYVQVGVSIGADYLKKLQINGKPASNYIALGGTGSMMIDFGYLGNTVVTLIDQIKNGTVDGGKLLDTIMNSGAEMVVNAKANLTFKLSDLTKKFLPDLSFAIGEITMMLTMGGGNTKLPRGFYLLISSDILKGILDAITGLFSFFKPLLDSIGFIVPKSSFTAARLAISVNTEAAGFEFDTSLGMIRCIFYFGRGRGGCQFKDKFFTAMLEGVKMVFKRAFKFLSETGEKIADFLVGAGKVVFNAVKNVGAAVVAVGGAVVKGAVSVVKSVAKAAVKVGKAIGKGIKKIFSGWRKRMMRLRLKFRRLRKMKFRMI